MCVCVCAHACVRVCTHVCMCVCVCLHPCACVGLYVWTSIHIKHASFYLKLKIKLIVVQALSDGRKSTFFSSPQEEGNFYSQDMRTVLHSSSHYCAANHTKTQIGSIQRMVENYTLRSTPKDTFNATRRNFSRLCPCNGLSSRCCLLYSTYLPLCT